jgi:apolipoprotein N-acyltransferase
MDDVVAVETPNPLMSTQRSAHGGWPGLAEVSLVITSAVLLILSFPDFDLWPLAWIGMVPLLVVLARPLKAGRALTLGCLWGVVFFYGTCWWLTYPMIHYARISGWLAYPLLLLPIALVSLFPALFSLLVSRLVVRFGPAAIFVAPLIWVSCEWARYAVTSQQWNALGYSQAFHPILIQPARWGGVYMISLLLLAVNAAVAFIVIRRRPLAVIPLFATLTLATLLLALAYSGTNSEPVLSSTASSFVIAVQPNVPTAGPDDPGTMEQLLNRHIELSLQGLRQIAAADTAARLVVWPESPMNFSYSRDPHLREVVGRFAQSNRTFVLLNSLEPAAGGGEHNSAVMVNEEGRIVAQYDKIRLMPFGEYVPLPRWLPGASSVRGIVGDFTPGSSYTLMPLGALRAGVFICIEAAHPEVARTFTATGADALINISNDGYLGPTPVMRQHLSNAIFRAVENNRLLLRVTNNGISAHIDRNGMVIQKTSGLEATVRLWPLNKKTEVRTFYSTYGDLFAYLCGLITLGLASATFITHWRKVRNPVSAARP